MNIWSKNYGTSSPDHQKSWKIRPWTPQGRHGAPGSKKQEKKQKERKEGCPRPRLNFKFLLFIYDRLAIKFLASREIEMMILDKII